MPWPMAAHKVSFSVKIEHLKKIYEIKAIKRGIQTIPVLLQGVSHSYYS